MDLVILKKKLNDMKIGDISVSKLNQKQYHEILSACAMLGEMRACVFVYDHMLSKKIKPTTETINILQKVHSKTVICNDTLLMDQQDPTKLLPRRRIHKIVKGANYSESYNKASERYLVSIKEFLETDASLKQQHKNKLIPRISKELSIPERDVRYVVTKLKRTKFLS